VEHHEEELSEVDDCHVCGSKELGWAESSKEAKYLLIKLSEHQKGCSLGCDGASLYELAVILYLQELFAIDLEGS